MKEKIQQSLKIVDNFLPADAFKEIQGIIMGNRFPWLFVPSIADKELDSDGYFVHNFFIDEMRGPSFNIVVPLLDCIDISHLIRCKTNLYVRQSIDKIYYHDYHKDLTFQHKVCMLCMNNNNGPFRHVDEKIDMIENRAIFFNAQTPHSSSTCTDAQVRVTLTVNYE
jgi:hypothetical protein